MAVWRWVVARATGIGEVSLGVLLPVVVAGLMFGATCGAPDEVMRGQVQPTGGNTGGSGGALSSPSSSGGTTGVAGSTATTRPTGGSVGPGGAGSSGRPGGSGGASNSGGNSDAGGTTKAGGSGGTGGISSPGGTGGRGSGGAATGGKATGGVGTGGTTASSTGGSGGATSPFGGTTATGGVATGGAGSGGNNSGGVATGGATRVSSGGAGGSGGKGGTAGSTSTAPPPTNGLAAYVMQKATGSPGQMTLSLQINNTTSQSVDMSAVTLRYWYQEEALGTASLEVDYASVGDSNDVKSKVHGTVVAAPAPAPGADHYLEISFTAVTLSPKGTAGNANLLSINGRLHNSGFQGAVDVTNDYSYNNGATGYDDKITLYQGGKLISGVAP